MPALAAEEQLYLSGFLTGLRERGSASVPMLPTGAPLDASKRLWLNGLLAGLFSHVEIGVQTAASPPIEASNSSPAVTLLWASQTGNAEALAERFAGRLRESGYEVRLACMADYATDRLAHEQVLLLVSSTYGDGDPPDNGHSFWEFLKSDAAPKLNGLRYAVLALGDPSYDQFCQHGKNLDARLAVLGASLLIPRSDCDPDYQRTADVWLEQVCQRVKESKVETDDDGDIAIVTAATTTRVTETPSKARPYASRLVTNLRSTPPEPGRKPGISRWPSAIPASAMRRVMRSACCPPTALISSPRFWA